jgi:PAS domain S-box-containing protein
MPSRSVSARLIGRLVLLTLYGTALILPLGYFAITSSTLTAELETEAEINARLITTIVNANPTMWRFEQARIEEYLDRRSRNRDPESRGVFDLAGEQVAVSSDPLPPPLITRSAPIYDTGAVVGRIDISRSLLPILARTTLSFLASLVLATAGYILLLRVPIGALAIKETELTRSEEKYRTLIETATDAIIVFDRETDAILEVNQSALRMLGTGRDQALGGVHSGIYPDGDAETFRQLVLRCADGGTALHEGLFIRGMDGARIPAEVSASILDLGGRAAVQARFTDMTAHKRAEERLVRAERMAALGTLTAGIAHHFNNINAIALGYLHLLEDDADASPSSRQYLGHVREAIDRAVLITSRLLVLSSTPAKLPSPVLVGDILHEMIAVLRPDIESEGVTLTVELKDSRTVRVEHAQLIFVIRTLLDNARQALMGQARRELRVATADDGDGTVLRVADTGIGIAQEKLSSLFTPFFSEKGERAPRNSPQARVRGMGLSLAMSYSIVTGWGGRIEVESDTDAGARFAVWLPASGAP